MKTRQRLLAEQASDPRLVRYYKKRLRIEAVREATENLSGETKYEAQWYPTSEMAPLNKREGGHANWYLGAWMRDGKTYRIHAVMCDSNGDFWLALDAKAKTAPDYWRQMPSGPEVRARAAQGAQRRARIAELSQLCASAASPKEDKT